MPLPAGRRCCWPCVSHTCSPVYNKVFYVRGLPLSTRSRLSVRPPQTCFQLRNPNRVGHCTFAGAPRRALRPCCAHRYRLLARSGLQQDSNSTLLPYLLKSMLEHLLDCKTLQRCAPPSPPQCFAPSCATACPRTADSSQGHKLRHAQTKPITLAHDRMNDCTSLTTRAVPELQASYACLCGLTAASASAQALEGLQQCKARRRSSEMTSNKRT